MVGLAATVLAATLAVAPSGSPAAGTQVLFHIVDPRITEASGIAVGRTSPDVVYVQNDSGDTNRFFALDRRTGATAATITVPAARNVDWEDLAVGPDGRGVASVWIGDIGANTARDEIRVYRVTEPRIDASGNDVAVQARGLATWRLRYPGAAHPDAESLAVSARGTAYVVTKSLTGTSVVYRVPPRPDADRVQSLVRVASVRFGFTGTPNRFGAPGQLVATGAAFSSDGTLFAVRTYADAYVWRVAGTGDAALAAALRTEPGRVPMPAAQQGEGITISGGRLLVDAEGARQPVSAVALPRIPATTPESTSPAGTPPAARHTASPNMGDGSPAMTLALLAGGAAGVVVVATAAAWTARRLWRRAVAKRRPSAG